MEMIPDQTLKKKKSSGEREVDEEEDRCGTPNLQIWKKIEPGQACGQQKPDATVDKKAKSPMWETTSFGLFGETQTLIRLVQFPGCFQRLVPEASTLCTMSMGRISGVFI